jgi:hypothetical protein
MRNELAMRLFSRRSLTESVAGEQIIALSDFAGGLMRPDKCGEFEPIRTPFNPTDITGPIRWLAKPHGEFFYRKGRPLQLCGEMWNLTHSPSARFPSPPFTNYWTGQFDGKWAHRVGIEKVEDFLVEMFRVTGSDFGILTTEIDLRAKNRPPNSYSYAGMDLETCVPGLYWINLFSAEYAGWLDLDHLPKELATLKHLSNGAASLRFCDSPDQCRSVEVLQKQRTAMEWLGSEKFFDIQFPDRKAVTPDWAHVPLPQVQSAG